MQKRSYSSFEKEEPPPKQRRMPMDLEGDYERVSPSIVGDSRLDMMPHTVLRNVFKRVSRDDRIELSNTCRRFRNFLINSKSVDLERRRTIERCRIEWCKTSSVLIMSQRYDGCRTFPRLLLFQKHIRDVSLHFFYEKVLIDLTTVMANPNSWTLSIIINVLEDLTDHVVGYSYSCPTIYPKIVDAFLQYPKLKEIEFETMPHAIWSGFCNTVSNWAHSQGMEVITGYGDLCFRKELLDGKMVLKILDDFTVPTSPNGSRFF